MNDLATVETPIERDRYGRPLVKPVGKLDSKPIPYTRCTTYIDCLDDRYNLEKWKMRQVALGIADNPDLALSAATYRDDKKQLDQTADKALEMAKSSAKATTGTALHSLTERIDRGQPLGAVPDTYTDDLDAYMGATSGMEMLEIERFVVNDPIKVGGTPDRILRHNGKTYIGDIKTGSITWAAGKIAMQLAIYANSLLYDVSSGRRSPLPDDLNKSWGVVIHLPAGEGRCELHWVDLTAGHEAVALAGKVRSWRARKDLLTAFDTATDPITQAIHSAATVDELVAVWAAHETEWTEAYTAEASTRKAALTGAT